MEGTDDPFAGARSTWRRDQARRRAAAAAPPGVARPTGAGSDAPLAPSDKQVVLELGHRVRADREQALLIDPVRQADLAQRAKLGLVSCLAGLLVVVMVALVVTNRSGGVTESLDLAAADPGPATTAVEPPPASDPAAPPGDPTAPTTPTAPAVPTAPASTAPPAPDPSVVRLADAVPPLLASGAGFLAASGSATSDGSINLLEAAVLTPLVEALAPLATTVVQLAAAVPAFIDAATAAVVAGIGEIARAIGTIVTGIEALLAEVAAVGQATATALQQTFADLGAELDALGRAVPQLGA